MTNFNVSAMTLDELKRLHKDLAKAIETFEQRKIAMARVELEALAKELGVSLFEIVGLPSKAKRGPATVKYRHPENSDLTWTGRGRKPKWFLEATSAGMTAAQLEIN